MAKISTYPLDTNLVGTDKWIGSDADNNFATNVVTKFFEEMSASMQKSMQQPFIAMMASVCFLKWPETPYKR